MVTVFESVDLSVRKKKSQKSMMEWEWNEG